MAMRSIILIAHNLRSAHNVGSLLRTAEGLGITHVYLTGYIPYPKIEDDTRLPHESAKVHYQIQKTALGAEALVKIKHSNNIGSIISSLSKDDYEICALEQDPSAVQLPKYVPKAKTALIVGREVEGIEPEIIKQADTVIEIPMRGQKESFNVVQAAAMALYHIAYFTN